MNTTSEAPSVSATACRSCGGTSLDLVLDLGEQPIANALLRPEDLSEREPRFPLKLLFCRSCSLAQVSETIRPSVLFDDAYPYYSSFIPALLEHSRKHVEDLLAEISLGSKDLVVEVASNDGYLLKNFVAANVPVLGVDPASGPVEAARRVGVPSLHAFFSAKVAQELVDQGYRADLMLANNVLAHVTDINDFVSGFAILLSNNGFAEFEFPYLKTLMEQCAFDTIYHEHVFYYSLTALKALFERHGLFLNDVRELAIHGGSLRLRVSRNEHATANLTRLLAVEQEEGLDHIAYYQAFAERVEAVKAQLLSLLLEYHNDGATIAAYGAAAKGATLLNYLDPPRGLIEYVVDRNTHKVGLYMPGVHIPILAVDELEKRGPTVLLILSWNFADEIVEQQQSYARQGGTFICPIPSPHVMRA